MCYDNYNQLLLNVNESRDCLVDIIGYFEMFEEDNNSDLLVGLCMAFKNNSIYIVIQDDDSFKLFQNNKSCSFDKLRAISIISNNPWLKAKGKPILWSWMLHNQQGYFDGLQIEFAIDSSDKSAVIQLVALAGEIKYREVSNECIEIKSNTLR